VQHSPAILFVLKEIKIAFRFFSTHPVVARGIEPLKFNIISEMRGKGTTFVLNQE